MGSIHPEAERTYFHANSDHRDIVKPFLHCFDVSHAYPHAEGKAKLAAFFLKPLRPYADHLGLDREILVTYSPYSTWQARTIALHEAVLDGSRARNRIDPLGSILISESPDVRRHVAEYLGRNKDRPPLLGMTREKVSELAQPEDVIRLITKELYRRDLFAVESPLEGDVTFFGREDLVTTLTSRFTDGQNSGVFGLRRIGKTSVLFAVQRRVSAHAKARTLYLDLREPGLYMLPWWELLQEIVRRMAEPLHLDQDEAPGRTRLRRRLKAVEGRYNEQSGGRDFAADLDALREIFTERKWLIALDEIENVTFDRSPSDHWTHHFLPFWQTLVSAHQRLRGQFCFVIAGVNPHALEAATIGRHDNPLFSTVRAFYVEPFGRDSIEAMVTRLGQYMGLGAESQVIDELHQEYGGHPFLTRRACSHMAGKVNSKPGTLTANLFGREKSNIARSLEKNAKQMLNVLAMWYPREYELVRRLAHGDIDGFSKAVQGDPELTEHVVGYGLVSTPDDNPRISIDIVRQVLAKSPSPQNDLAQSVHDRDAVIAEISRRRDPIEIRLRELLRQGLRFKHGQTAATRATNALSERRRPDIAQYSYDEMWDELYFSDLGNIMAAEWAAVENYMGESKDEVMKWVNHINRHRVDAHAKTISEEDLAYLRVCFGRLERILDIN